MGNEGIPNVSRKEIMLGIVETLYNSNAINDETYKEVKKTIQREVKS